MYYVLLLLLKFLYPINEEDAQENKKIKFINHLREGCGNDHNQNSFLYTMKHKKDPLQQNIEYKIMLKLKLKFNSFLFFPNFRFKTS